jgi:hypothetical protein
LFGTLVGTQNLFSGIYWLLPPIIMTILGGSVGALLYDILVAPSLQAKAVS